MKNVAAKKTSAKKAATKIAKVVTKRVDVDKPIPYVPAKVAPVVKVGKAPIPLVPVPESLPTYYPGPIDERYAARAILAPDWREGSFSDSLGKLLDGESPRDAEAAVLARTADLMELLSEGHFKEVNFNPTLLSKVLADAAQRARGACEIGLLARMAAKELEEDKTVLPEPEAFASALLAVEGVAEQPTEETRVFAAAEALDVRIGNDPFNDRWNKMHPDEVVTATYYHRPKPTIRLSTLAVGDLRIEETAVLLGFAVTQREHYPHAPGWWVRRFGAALLGRPLRSDAMVKAEARDRAEWAKAKVA